MVKIVDYNAGTYAQKRMIPQFLVFHDYNKQKIQLILKKFCKTK